jgi:predicted transcriptional regulator
MKSGYQAKNKYERAILAPLESQNMSSEGLLNQSELDVQTFNVHFTMLEICGAIERSASGAWRLAK